MWYTQFVGGGRGGTVKLSSFIHYIFLPCGFSIETNTRLQWPKTPVHILGHQCSNKKKLEKGGGGVMWLFSIRYLLKHKFKPTENNENSYCNGNYHNVVTRKLLRN